MPHDDSHDSMSVSASRDDSSNGRGTGPEGHGDGGNSSSGNGKRSSVNFSKTPEKQAIVNPWLLGLPANLAIIEGTWGVTINTTTLTSPLGRLVGLLESSLPMAGRLSAIGALFYSKEIGLDTIDPAFREHQQQLAKLVSENKQLQEQTYSFTALPVDIVTDIPVKEISRQKTVPAKVVVEQSVSPEKNKVAPAMTKNPQQVNVVQAKKTGRPGIYSVEIAPGKPALQIGLSDKKPSQSFKTPSYDNVKPESVIPSVTSEPYQGIVDFGGDHAPIYISISKNLTAEEEKKQAETARIDWEIHNPIEAAEQNYNKVFNELAAAEYFVGIREETLQQRKLFLTQLESIHSKYKNERDFPAQGITVGRIKVSFRELESSIILAKEQIIEAENQLAKMKAIKSKKEKEKQKAKDKKEKEEKRKGVKEKGHDYHPDPETEEIKGLGELKEAKKKTPKQGGGGKRARWIGDKGRKIYEWDSQHGELEGYRGSDGQHIGVFDPKTGKQLKPADPKRNIKKYL